MVGLHPQRAAGESSVAVAPRRDAMAGNDASGDDLPIVHGFDSLAIAGDDASATAWSPGATDRPIFRRRPNDDFAQPP
jgi:hypothetical protein